MATPGHLFFLQATEDSFLAEKLLTKKVGHVIIEQVMSRCEKRRALQSQAWRIRLAA